MRSVLLILLLIIPLTSHAGGIFDLPPLPPPEHYGDLIIDQFSSQQEVEGVAFSHWQHRRHFTCNVCHTELGFSMQANQTGIREEDNRSGRYCGACHNGLTAFALKPNCQRCHTGKLADNRGKFRDWLPMDMPRTLFGNEIDWVLALQEKRITPATSLDVPAGNMFLDRDLVLEAEWNFVPPAVFPHQKHLGWMDCNMCHPDLFMIKKKSTEHFYMAEILKGRFCGVCHLKVAFPMDDCVRCHPGMNK